MPFLWEDEFGNVYEVGGLGVVTNWPTGEGSYAPLGTDVGVQPDQSNQSVALSELASLHGTLLVNNNLISSGTGDDNAKQMPTYVVQRPWIEPPEGAVSFDPASKIALGAVGTIVTVLSFTVPDGYDGVINAYSWNFEGGGFVNGSGDLVVQVLRNGAPIRNYDDIEVEKGTVGIPRPISPLRIYSKQVISLTVNHVANALLAGDVIASFVGYFYPSAS